MNNSIRDKWCEKEISDLDYIRHLEAEKAKLKEPKACTTCKHYDDSECYNKKMDAIVEGGFYRFVIPDKNFSCCYHELKEQ